MLSLSESESVKPEQNDITIPRLVIGAPSGRSGKTTFTLGLLRALARQGVRVQPYKKGPDYIDTSWHTLAAGAVSRNLDAYFMNGSQICASLRKHAPEQGISIIEGAMGLYDGSDLQGSSSTAEIAKQSGSPVLLVVDSTRMTRSIAAMVMGYQHFDPEVRIVGVVLNRVARNRHEKVAREAIEEFCKIPVVGAIPKDVNLTIPDRHLGLVTCGEFNEAEQLLDYFADIITQHVDLKLVTELAKSALAIPFTPVIANPQAVPGLKVSSSVSIYQETNSAKPKAKLFSPKIGVIQDEAFSFYYPENLEALQELGAQRGRTNFWPRPIRCSASG